MILLGGLSPATAPDDGAGGRASLAAADDSTQVAIPGRVLARPDSTPVAGATVAVYSLFRDRAHDSTTTGDDGRYRLTVAAPAKGQRIVRVEATAPGRARDRMLIGVEASGQDPVRLAMAPRASDAEPIAIKDLETLRQIGRSDDYPLDAAYVLASDLDASATAEWNDGRGFRPIGHDAQGRPTDRAFTGTFDGQGHTISGLTIDRPDRDEPGKRIGLFARTEAATIQNLTLADVSVTGNATVGAIVASSGTLTRITNCTVTGTVRGWTEVGGLVGLAEFTRVQGASARGTIGAPTESDPIYVSTFSAAGARRLGGLAGKLEYSMIRRSRAAVDVVPPEKNWGVEHVGGLVGQSGSGSEIRHAHATGALRMVETPGDNTVEANGVGGLVGTNARGGTLIYASSATGAVEATMFGGGLVGQLQGGTLRASYATGPVRGGSRVGGLTGYSVGIVESSYATGAVSGEAVVGGLVGKNHGRVRTSFAVGTVSSAHTTEAPTTIGGLVGEGRSTSPAGEDETTTEQDDQLLSSYWDRTTTGQARAYGDGDAAPSPDAATDDDYARGLPTDQMTGAAARKHMTWLDFETTWQVVSGDYPALRWEAP